ncbi:ABC transporter substrate-binding protein [Paenibacillus sambharensis]|uniref:ABC transporter substrate-binding protein n=1 Tax=Paenibacillus sambharensis TaxID=1803190 RepID=A0A2W1LX80_9BACL|nr:extracellular solute-binding protein [Paenibacillus sambharensis]PZD96127.1 ABC transporter substrate-binding protein [Paenibacillus sambharensis]
MKAAQWGKTLLAAMLAGAMLTACSGNENLPASTNGNAAAPASAEGSADPLAKYEPVEGKKYTISWLPYEKVPVPKDAEMVKFYEEKFNVDFDIWNLDHANVVELFNMRLAAGEIPDYNRNAVKTNTLPQYVDQGVLAEIPEEVIKKYMPTIYENAMKLDPNWLKYASVDGKIYGLPILSDAAEFRSTIVWRGDWLEKVGITKTPDTLEEFEEAFYKFANEDPDGNGVKDTYGLSQSGLQAIFGAYGVLPGYGPHKWQDWFWMEKDGRIVNAAVMPEAKEALKLLNKWYKDGVLDPEFITGENTGDYWGISHAFVNGKIGFTGHGQNQHWYEPLAEIEGDKGGRNYEELAKKDPAIAKAIRYGLPPAGVNGERTLFANNYVDAPVIVFGKQLEDEPDKLGKILQILEHNMGTTKENFYTANLGIKGKHWDSDDETLRTFKILPPYNEMEGNVYGAGIFASDFLTFTMNEVKNEWARKNGFSEGAVRNKLIGALPSDDMYKAELIKLRDEAYISIITGDKPVDYFDEFVKKWNAAGGEQATKEANEWQANLAK